MPLPPVHAPIACETRSVDLAAMVRASNEAYAEGEMSVFYENLNGVQEQLTCVHEPLTPQQVAGIHLLFGLANVRAKDEASAIAAFRAAYEVDPEVRLAPDLLEIEAVARLIEEAHASPVDAKKAFLAPEGTTLLVDGVPATTTPTRRPYVLQVVWTADASVHWTGYLPGSTYNLDLSALGPPPPPCPALPPPAIAQVPPISPWLTIGAAGSTLLATGLVGYGGWLQGRFTEGTIADDQDTGADGNLHAEAQTFGAKAPALLAAGGAVGALAISLDITVLLKVAHQGQGHAREQE